jgi:DNA-binding transcriptional MerR regulator
MEQLFISDAAKKVQVESHVLRYWEEELKLPIKRNEVGHRYYTDADIERFIQIKNMKERGLQLKAIKMILKDGKLDVLPMGSETREELMVEESAGMAIEVVEKKEVVVTEESREEKAQRLQWLLKQLIKETLEENNKELSKEIRESVVKEMDYQFRCQEERELERDKEREKRNEEYYQRMDALLCKKAGRAHKEKEVKSSNRKDKGIKNKPAKMVVFKKKRHLL